MAALCGGGGRRVVPVIDDGAGVGGAAGDGGDARAGRWAGPERRLRERERERELGFPGQRAGPIFSEAGFIE